MNDVAERAGVRHLVAIGGQPRPAGSTAEQEARDYASDVLRTLGFDVREERFGYSEFPGRYGTPLSGAFLAAIVLMSSWRALATEQGIEPAMLLLVGLSITTIFARWMLLHGVITAPLMRSEGINVIATRGGVPPRVWLVAHLDSKSQPVPSAVRVGGVVVLAAALVLSVVATMMTLAGMHSRTMWWGAVLACVAGAIPVMASVVGERSDGAVDNASGVAAVLAAAGLLAQEVPCGVLLPSAEELGLAGARAWTMKREPGVALNCDGVDDEGSLVIMYNGRTPTPIVDSVQWASGNNARVRRMPVGLLTDSSALASRGWQTATVSFGSLATLRRIHTSRDSLDLLRGASIDAVAVILARAAEALAS